MTERPILFKGRLVRAILEGRKTQTRRIRNLTLPEGSVLANLTSYAMAQFRGPLGNLINRRNPFGAPGDRLWVRETWATVFDCPDLPCCEDGENLHRRVVYRADDERGLADYACSFECSHDQPGCARWKPSIHMPRWASRLTLEVTGIRVERLQDISEEDAQAEGVRELPLQEGAPGAWWSAAPEDPDLHARDPVAAFRKAWDSINPASPWTANPWVWRIAFR